MAETVVEKSVCGSCGASVRDSSLFCYSCGESVSVAQGVEISKPTQNNGRIVEKLDSIALDDPIIAEEPIADEKSAEPEPEADDRTKLRSAASMRRRAKAYNRKPVEVVWVERERPSAFVVVSIVLVVFAAVLLALAMYLK